MAERFERLYSLQNNMYSVGSPVIVSAGALLKDNQSGKVLAQIKYQNVSGTAIKALKVSLMAFDISGKEVTGVNEYQYLDLNVKNGESFGGDKAILLPDSVTRKIEISAITVVLASGASVMAIMPLSSLPEGKKLGNALDSQGLVDQYRLETNNSAQYVPQEVEGLWQCACGCWNGTERCSSCGANKADIFGAFDEDELSEKLAVRLAKEKAEREEKARKEEEERKEQEKKARIAAEEAAMQRKKNKKKAAVVVTMLATVAVAIAVLVVWIIPEMQYNQAIDLYTAGNYQEAIVAFTELDGYKDSIDWIDKSNTAILDGKYNDAVALMDTGKYNEAIAAFEELNGHRDSKSKIADCNTAIKEEKYNDAIVLMTSGAYSSAITIFDSLDGYKDSNDKSKECRREQHLDELKTAKVGDIVVFGEYEQDNNKDNGKEEIEWIVLAKDGNRLYVTSRYCLDGQVFDAEGSTLWETSALRVWLNSTFINEAFDSEWKKMIPTVTLETQGAKSKDPVSITQDKVFLLTGWEAERYFGEYGVDCRATTYAVKQGVKNYEYGKYCCWWLRDSSRSGGVRYAASWVYDKGENPRYKCYGIRPALWITIPS